MYRMSETIPTGLVLRPTEKEFKDFKTFLYSVLENPKYKDAGIVKVIPPKSFKYDRLSYSQALSDLTVIKPIEQQICNGKGILMRIL
jgi:hypothetical protein